MQLQVKSRNSKKIRTDLQFNLLNSIFMKWMLKYLLDLRYALIVPFKRYDSNKGI